jgi:hypothetical protein
MNLRLTHILSVAGLALAPLAPAGCATPTSCSIADGADGTATLSCTDGSSYVIRNGADGVNGVDGKDGGGKDGADGTSCAVEQKAGTTTITCSDGSTASISGGGGGAGVLPTFPTLAGNFNVESSADIALLEAMAVTEITGSLSISSTALTDLSLLANITTIGNTLAIGAFGGTTLKGLENLTSVGGLILCSYGPNCPNLTSASELTGFTTLATGSLLVGGALLTSLTFPNLTTIAGDLGIGGTALTTVALPKLTSVGGGLQLSGQKLTAFALPELTTVGERIEVQNALAITSLSLPKLTTAKVLYMLELPELSSINFAKLESVPNQLYYGGLLVRNCPKLASVAFPELTSADTFVMESNALLTSVSVPKLTSCPNMTMHYCPKLPNCVCTNLATKLMVSGNCNENDAMGVCN